MVFLQLHARLQQRCEPRALRLLLSALAASLPRLLLAEALSPWRLLQVWRGRSEVGLPGHGHRHGRTFYCGQVQNLWTCMTAF